MKKIAQNIASKFGYRLAKPLQKLKQEASPELIWDCLTKGEARRLFHYEQIQATKEVFGDVVECGVATGATLIYLMMASRELKIGRNFWGFDTFEGFPESQEEDGNYLTNNRREVYDELLSNGVGVNLHYIPVYLQPYYFGLGFNAGHCPNAEAYFKTAISIPIYSALTEKNQQLAISKVEKDLYSLSL